MNDPQVVRRPVTRVTGRSHETLDDALAVERALEMRVDGQAVAVTLRTPGHDRELALGFLAGENVIQSANDVVGGREEPSACNDAPDVLDLLLRPGLVIDWSKLERHFTATAACGLCGRAHLDAMRVGLTPVPQGARFDVEQLLALPARVRTQQTAFEATGGLHAAV